MNGDVVVVTQPADLPGELAAVALGEPRREPPVAEGADDEPPPVDEGAQPDLPAATAQALRRLGKPYRRWLRMRYAFSQLSVSPATKSPVTLDRGGGGVSDEAATSEALGPPEELGLQHAAARLLGNAETLDEPPEPVPPRLGVLCSYRPDWSWSSGAEVSKCGRLPPLPPSLFQPNSGRRRSVRLEVADLDLSLGILEPMQLVLTLYNLRVKRRASESAVISLRPGHVPLPLVCAFLVWDCVVDEMTVVCRLEKVISGDAGVKERDYGEGRARSTIGDEKKLLRLSERAQRHSSRFEDYRSPLGIGALSLAQALDPNHRLELYKWKSSETNVSEQLVVQSSEELLEGNNGDRKHIGSASMATAPAPAPDLAQCRRCLRDYTSTDPRKLSYAAGDIIRVLANHDVGWWIGRSDELVGLFLASDTEPCEPVVAAGESPRSPIVSDLSACSTKLQNFRTAPDEPTRSTAGFSNAMFLYPQRLLVNNNRNLALRIQLCDGADGRTSPVSDQAFFSRYGDGGNEDDMRCVSDSYLSCVHTRTKVCDFTDECRVELPMVQDVRQYYLFTVLHINMQTSSKVAACCSSRPKTQGRATKGGIETVVGYACLPLYKTDRESPCLIDDGSYRLKVNTATPLFETPTRVGAVADELGAMSLDVRVQNLTSIHATDSLTRELIDAHASCVESREGAEEQATAAVLAVLAVPEGAMRKAVTSVEFGVFADALFAFLAMRAKELAEASFKLLCDLVAFISGRHYRHSIPAWYVHHLNTFHDDGYAAVPLHDSLCDLIADWMTDDESIDDAKTKSVRMWFFFEVIVKSITNSGCSPGTEDRYTAADGQVKESYDPARATFSDDSIVRLTTATATLVKAGVSTHAANMQQLNKDFAMFTKDLLSLCTSGRKAMLAYLAELDRSPELSELKWTYIAIVADHEHSLQLKLSGIVLQAAVAAIKTEDLTDASIAMATLCEILTKHSFDACSNPCFDNTRSQAEQYNAATVGAEYFTFVLEVLDCVPHAYWAAPMQVSADLLSCLLFIMQSLGPYGLYSWVKVECERRLRVLLRVLEVITIRFDCPGRRKDFSVPLNISAQVAVLAPPPPAELGSDAPQAESPKQSFNDRVDTVYKYEAAVSESYNLAVLDVLSSLLAVQDTSQTLDVLAANICRVLVGMLGRQKLLLSVGFEALRCLEQYLVTFAEITLSPEFTAGTELSYCLLLLCSTNGREFREFRQQATLVLFQCVQLSLLILPRVSFPVLTSHLTRGLATLSDKLSNDGDLVSSIHLLNELARQESDNTVSATAEVADLSEKLGRILSASARLRETDGADVAGKVELYEELVEAYSSALDLSVSWCISQAGFHIAHGNHAEAAATYTRAACMLAGQLEESGAVPRGTRERLLRVVPWYVPKEAYDDGKDTDQAAKRAMLEYVEQAASAYKDGGLFETAVLAYQVLTHVYDYDGSLEFPKLALLHGNIRSMYQLAIAAESSEARMLGTYFRVGFYGAEFGVLDGQQYIHKYPKITQIVEVKEAMVAMWTKKIRARVDRSSSAVDADDVNVNVVSTSHPVDADALDGPHLQITKVDPMVDDDRRTHYQRNTDITQFMFESPFTLDGKGQAAIDVQWVRRTVLTVSKPFPCTCLRQLVVSSEPTETAPIANAIEIVKRRGRQLRKVANLDNGVFSSTVQLGDSGPNRNMLEQALCGSLLLQVNGGALEVASSFLRRVDDEALVVGLQQQESNPPEQIAAAVPPSSPTTDDVSDDEDTHLEENAISAPEAEQPENPEANTLRGALSDFLACCTDALGVYAIAPSTQELLTELQRGLVSLMRQMAAFGVFPPPPPRRSTGASGSANGHGSARASGAGGHHRRSNSFSRSSAARGSVSMLGRVTLGGPGVMAPGGGGDQEERVAAAADLPIAEMLARVRAAVEETRPAADATDADADGGSDGTAAAAGVVVDLQQRHDEEQEEVEEQEEEEEGEVSPTIVLKGSRGSS